MLCGLYTPTIVFLFFNPNIQFTYESSLWGIVFLDLEFDLCNGRLESTVHVKPTGRHQYLHYSPSDPEHTKWSIESSQTLRVDRISSRENNFWIHCFQMKSWLLKRKYPEKLIHNEMKKVKFFPLIYKIRSLRKEYCL